MQFINKLKKAVIAIVACNVIQHILTDQIDFFFWKSFSTITLFPSKSWSLIFSNANKLKDFSITFYEFQSLKIKNVKNFLRRHP